MELKQQKRAFETFVRLDRSRNQICMRIKNALFNLAHNKDRFLEACYFCYKNPEKAVTKKFIKVIKDCENKKESIEILYSETDKPKINYNQKIPCPKCKNKAMRIEGSFFRCNSCKDNFYYDFKKEEYIQYAKNTTA